MNDVRNVLQVLITLLFPQKETVQQFEYLQASDLASLAVVHELPTDIHCIAPLPYKHSLVRNAVHAAKFYGHKRAAQLLGEAIAPFVAEELSEQAQFGSFQSPILFPVPLHATRKRSRGFNQSERIAKQLAESIGEVCIPVETNVLERTRDTASQTKLSRSKRLGNMHAAFTVSNAEKVRNMDIILVDDVTTTGATFKAAQEALLAAGARNILCVAAAH